MITSKLLLSIWFVVVLQLLCHFVVNAADNNKDKTTTDDENDLSSSSALFEPSNEIQVLAPSSFNKPTHLFNDPNIDVIVQPTFGKHRADKDAVFAYAEGYTIEFYRIFIETLEATGFDGDVVLAIADKTMVREHVEEYLRGYAIDNDKDGKERPNGSKVNLIVYMHELSCFERDGITKSKRKFAKSGAPDIFQMCCLDNVYGWKENDSSEKTKPAIDVRDGRVVATLRYEWYWIWSLQYNPHTWIMLIDARDTFFQSNPFTNLPRTQSPSSPDEQDNGYLYFFGENTEVTRIGISTKNRNWIKNGYGDNAINALMDKPTICSGSTMGEQIALETYLRALINEWDETEIRMTGSDQGFHNYLYYSSKLHAAKTIKKLIVWEQGKGIINNLSALRTKTLKEWGIYNSNKDEVYQWDQITLSPVVHQWDRDKELHKVKQQIMRKMKQWPPEKVL